MIFSIRAKFNFIPYIEHIFTYLFFLVNVDIDILICKCMFVYIYWIL